jgi:hypothetical protein
MSDPTIAELISEHDAVLRELRPTLVHYSELGGRAVELQKRIFVAKLRELFPDVVLDELPRVTTIAATESLPSLQRALEALRENNILPSRVIFDPVRNEYHVFTSVPADA